MLRLVYELSIDRLMVSVTMSNHSLRRIEADVAWALDADFADIQEAHARRQRSTLTTVEIGERR